MSFRRIEDTLDRLDALYEDQINSFDRELLPDLEAQTAKRKEVFNRLKEVMKSTLPKMGDQTTLDNRPELEGLILRVRTVLHQNSILKTRVTNTKEGLKQSMSRITTGRKAMNAYGSPQSVRSRPRVLTVRN